MQKLLDSGKLSSAEQKQALKPQGNLSALLAKHALPALQRPIEIIAFSDEEGVR